MRSLVFVLAVLTTVPASAQLTMTVRESPQMYYPFVPYELRDMKSPRRESEFYAWAIDYNIQAAKECQKIAEEQRAAGKYRTRTAQVWSQNSSTQSTGSPGTLSRGGNGYGYGGFGGFPLYATTVANGSAGYSNSGGYGGGYYSRQGLSSQSSAGGKSYIKEYPDHDDNGGGPLTLINPYCADYWCK